MNIAYWNTNKNSNLNCIIDILLCRNIDVIFLSEIDVEVIETNNDFLSKNGYEYFHNPGCERVKIVKKISLEIELKQQNYYYTVVRETENDINIISIHSPSQMYQNMKALKEFIRDFRCTIDNEIGGSLDRKIIVIGDFNINPHEEAMIDFDGFLATNSTRGRKTITHLKKQKTTYYNPTWQLYSRTNFPGTKAFRRPSASVYDVLEFHFLDQVVISQNLLSALQSDYIEVIEDTDNFILFDKVKNLILGSDHLPLLYSFNLKKL
jgi:exonuclease III